MRNYLSDKFIVPLVSLILSFFIYWQLFFTFYQQDEWQGVGHMLASGLSSIIYGYSPLNIIIGDGRPLGALLNYVLFLAVPFNTVLISSYAIIMHAVVGILVFYLCALIFKNSLVSWVSMIVFLSNSVGNQAVIWSGTSAPTLTATALIVMSLALFLNYLKQKKNKLLIYAYITLLLSFYFKETGLVFLIIYVVLDSIFNWKRFNFALFVRHSIFPLLYFFIFMLIHVFMVLTASHQVGVYVNSSLSVKSIIISNILTYCFTLIGQMILPIQFVVGSIKDFLLTLYPYLSCIITTDKQFPPEYIVW